MKHPWDFECRCTDCTSFELALRAQLQLDERKRQALKYACKQTILELPVKEPYFIR